MSKVEEGFNIYLRKRRNRKADVDKEIRGLEIFIRWMERKGITTAELTYQDIMDYISYSRGRGNHQNTISHKIRIIKYWLDYKYVVPNPCKGWYMKRRPQILPSGLLTEIELEEMYYQHPQGTALEKRDKVMLGLMIYQGMNGGHLKRLKVEEVNLEVGFIIIKKTLKTGSRSIKIRDAQRPILEEYIKEIRAQILAKAGHQEDSEMLIVKTGSQEEVGHFYQYYYKRQSKRYAKFRSIRQVRASVISNWLKDYNLREVQYMAGHKYVSSTERYLGNRVEDLQRQLDELHPLR